jgi:NAD+ synthase
MMADITLNERIRRLAHSVRHSLQRSGAVVQVSGGIDSAVTLHLAARALSPHRVLALFMPDDATAPVSYDMARLAAESAGCELQTHSIAALVAALTTPDQVTAVVRRYVHDFDADRDGYAINVDPDASLRLATPVFRLHVGPRRGRPTTSVMLRPADLRALMAIQNVKQRLRMTVAYRYAEEQGFAVLGATNADELDFGFTVKFGDDAADIYAIADLSKSGVRDAAVSLDVPEDLRARQPTTDTFTLDQSQAEYYYLADAESLRAIDSTEASAYNESAMGSIMKILHHTAYFNSQRLRLDWNEDGT